MIKFQYVSDLHLEFPENCRWIKEKGLEVTGDVLLVAGDSGYIESPDYKKHPFWKWASQHYREVIIALGNHEFYQYSDLTEWHDGWTMELYPNIHAYYNRVVTIEDVDIIVSTLWAHIDPVESYITEHSVNDFRRIRYDGHLLSSESFNAEHDKCVTFIKEAISKSTARAKIVLTHHVPTRMCMDSEFRNSMINGAFVCELGYWIAETDIDVWVYGHSHRNIDAEIERTDGGICRILSNQLGYIYSEEHLRNGFSPDKVFEI